MISGEFCTRAQVGASPKLHCTAQTLQLPSQAGLYATHRARLPAERHTTHGPSVRDRPWGSKLKIQV